MSKETQKETLKTFKQALWDFILEHCDIDKKNGELFVKFHTSGRTNLENRIKARWKYSYHREDVHAKKNLHKSLKRKHGTFLTNKHHES